MLQEYPKRYAKGELEFVFENLDSSTRKRIEGFLSYCKITAGERKISDIKRNITQFFHIVGCPHGQLSLAHLREFLGLLNYSNREKYTKNGIKSSVKRFIIWNYKNWSKRFEDLRDIKLEAPFNHKKVNEGTILKKEDIEKVMNTEIDLVIRTFFITLYESGVRPQELRMLEWKSCKLESDGEISVLHVYSTKTQRARPVYVKEATRYLKRLRVTSSTEYVFPSIEKPGQCISKPTACRWIKIIGKAGLGRDIFPYLLRHSRATELYGELPSKIAQKFLDHKQDMSELYSHLSSDQVKKKLLETVYKTEDLPSKSKAQYEARIALLESDIAKLKAQLDQWEEKIDSILTQKFLEKSNAGKMIQNFPNLCVTPIERNGRIVLRFKDGLQN